MRVRVRARYGDRRQRIRRRSVFPHAFFFVIASVLKLDQKVCLVEAPLIGMDRSDFLPNGGGVHLVFDLKKSGLVNASSCFSRSLSLSGAREPDLKKAPFRSSKVSGLRAVP